MNHRPTPITRRAFGLALVASIILVTGGAPAPTPAKAIAPATALDTYQQTVRSAYGLRADLDTIRTLRGSAADVGTPDWGFPMSQDEATRLDINGRNAFVSSVSRDLLPYVSSLANFGGAWIDQKRDGRLVVSLVSPDAAEIRAISALQPSHSRGVEIVSATLTRSQLVDAATGLSSDWALRYPGVRLLGISVDESTGSLRADVEAAPWTSKTAVPSGDSYHGVPVVITSTTAGADATCTGADNCYNPFEAGTRIYASSSLSSTSGKCTMGFQVVKGTSDIEFLTAGHCAKWSGNQWYLRGYGLMGAEDGTAYAANGYDVMKVQMPDSQKSTLIFGVSGPQVMTQSRNPLLGESVCFYGSFTLATKCGTVTAVNFTWTSEGCNCTVKGSRSNLIPIEGDSGAPLYSRTYVTGSSNYWLNTPLGVVDHQNGGFAKVIDAQTKLGVQIYH